MTLLGEEGEPEELTRKMDQNFDLQAYMSKGVERVVTDALKKAVIFVEFVPVTEESKDLAPGDAE